MEIKPGDRVIAEHTIGHGDTAKTHTIEGIVFLDCEGVLRIRDHAVSPWDVNLTTDADGYFRSNVLVVSVTPGGAR